MRYPAAEKLEILRLVEQSRLPVRRTLDKLGVLPARFYRWYDRYQSGGYEALKDRPPRPKQVWNRIPDDVRGRVLRLALDAPELSPRELATRFIDTEGDVVSEASVYRLLKGTRPDHQSSLRCDQGRRRVQGQDRQAQSAVADRLHLPQGHRLGLVLSLDYPRRLLTLYHRLETLHDDADRRRHTGACNIATPLPKIINQVSQSLRYFRPHPVSNHLTTDSEGLIIARGLVRTPR